jgi:hypothetical protein
VLSQGGVQLVVLLSEPATAVFTSTAVDLKPPQYSTAGIYKLMVVLPKAEKIVVCFTLKSSAQNK